MEEIISERYPELLYIPLLFVFNIWASYHMHTDWSKGPAVYFELTALVLAYVAARKAVFAVWENLEWPPGLMILLGGAVSAAVAAAAISIFLQRMTWHEVAIIAVFFAYGLLIGLLIYYLKYLKILLLRIRFSEQHEGRKRI